MDLVVQFVYREKDYSSDAYLSFEEEPYYIFVSLKDADLIREFGDEITIKTDGETVLPRRNDFPALHLLYQTIFDALKTSRPFLLKKAARQTHGLPVTFRVV